MSDFEQTSEAQTKEPAAAGRIFKKPAVFAALVSLVGVADAAYLTAKHYTDKNVPCNLFSGCEQVLKSSYAEIFGIPTAAFGLLAYFTVFSLAVLTAYGSFRLWNLFGAAVALMVIFTGWLIYLQAFVIQAFCQFCLISAATTFTLLIVFIVSQYLARKSIR